MPVCEVCGGTRFQETTVEEIFQVGGHYLLVEGIPATVCERCGEKTFSATTAETIRHRLNESRPQVRRTIALDAVAY